MGAAQKWIKQGRIFELPATLGWGRSHAALPVAEKHADRYRIYFSTRDEKARAQIGSFDINLNQPREILRVSPEPIIGLGALGTFDDCGVTTSCVVDHRGRRFHYYSGWTLGVSVPFYFYIGLAVSDDGGESYRKWSQAPLLERNAIDPYLTASPYVLVENDIWRMWYVSGTGWELHDAQPRHYYHIKYAESRDGINWERAGLICIDYESADEYAIARPCVLKDNGTYKMWYSHRGASYRGGYAESLDGLKWERKDHEFGLDVSASGWDAQMIAYPYVFDDAGKRYMLYNGNGYGESGIGLAMLERYAKGPL